MPNIFSQFLPPPAVGFNILMNARVSMLLKQRVAALVARADLGQPFDFSH
jgi:hypothetical protein